MLKSDALIEGPMKEKKTFLSKKFFDIVISFTLNAVLNCTSVLVAMSYVYKDVANVNENLPCRSKNKFSNHVIANKTT